MSGRVELARLAWAPLAETLGFSADAAGRRRRGALTLEPEGEWLALVDRGPGAEALVSDLGTPGLWRSVPGAGGRARVHELPPLRAPRIDAGADAGADADAGASELAWFAPLLDWALATRAGGLPAGWAPPADDELAGWLDGRLVARGGGLVARGETVRGPERLALVFRELGRLPAALAPVRRAWVDGLCADVRRRWRLVRLGVDPASGALAAEVDLTGVPAPCARPLVQLSLAALVRAVEQMLVPLSFLLDPGAASRALERPFDTQEIAR